MTLTELRANLEDLLDEILKTGLPLEIQMGDRKLQIIPVGPVDKIKNLMPRPDVIQGDPDDLVDLRWDEVNLDMP